MRAYDTGELRKTGTDIVGGYEMLKIGEFSKLSHVSVRMLRHYDEIGLLHPQRVDPITGYRLYGEEQLFTASKINVYRGMGLPYGHCRTFA